jgi:pimeloyl-ACP methyl ester carboxylesterase
MAATAARTYDEVSGWLAYQPFLPPELRVDGNVRPAETYWDRPNARVHLDEWDTAGSPLTVIALHGAGGHGRLMAPFCLAVRQDGYRAVAPDLPLFGLTEVTDRLPSATQTGSRWPLTWPSAKAPGARSSCSARASAAGSPTTPPPSPAACRSPA